MKTFEFSKDSWHYKLMDHWDPSLTRCGTDLCTYTRSLVFALILYSMIVSFLIGLACYTLFAIGNLLGALFFGYAWHPVTIVVLGAELTGGALVGFILWNEKRKERDRDNPKEPGFVGLAYRSWKDKFCAKVEFK